MNENKSKLIKYRLDRAFNCLKEADNLIKDKLWFGATNRLYYSCFYAVIAVLLIEDLSAKTHKGTKNLFYQNFISNGIFDKSLIEYYNEAFTFRNESDYLDFIELEPEVITELYNKTKLFITTINEFISSRIQC